MKTVSPYVNFKGNTEEAFNFYKSVFGGDFLQVIRFKDFGGKEMGLPDEDMDKIMHIALPLGKDNMLMATDVLESQGQSLTVGNNVYISIETESEEEAERLFTGLSAGGGIETPLEKSEWAEKFGICKDRFGIQWMISYTGNAQFGGSEAE